MRERLGSPTFRKLRIHPDACAEEWNAVGLSIGTLWKGLDHRQHSEEQQAAAEPDRNPPEGNRGSPRS